MEPHIYCISDPWIRADRDNPPLVSSTAPIRPGSTCPATSQTRLRYAAWSAVIPMTRKYPPLWSAPKR